MEFKLDQIVEPVSVFNPLSFRLGFFENALQILFVNTIMPSYTDILWNITSRFKITMVRLVSSILISVSFDNVSMLGIPKWIVELLPFQFVL